MKKLIAAIFVITIFSCSNNTKTTNSGSDSTNVTNGTSKADTTAVPDGVTSGNPESRDTSAMRPLDTAHK
jgi:uncharacterized lipoprotein